MKKDLDPHIKVKTILSLHKLLSSNKKRPHKDDDEVWADSYEKIGNNADLRKATVSDVFNGKSSPDWETLILIIKGMGFNLVDFAREFETITNSEIDKYKKSTKVDNNHST